MRLAKQQSQEIIAGRKKRRVANCCSQLVCCRENYRRRFQRIAFFRDLFCMRIILTISFIILEWQARQGGMNVGNSRADQATA
jgi:hypothetical protein